MLSILRRSYHIYKLFQKNCLFEQEEHFYLFLLSWKILKSHLSPLMKNSCELSNCLSIAPFNNCYVVVTLHYWIMVTCCLHHFCRDDFYLIHDDCYFITFSHDDYLIHVVFSSNLYIKMYPCWLFHPWWFLLDPVFECHVDYFIITIIR